MLMSGLFGIGQGVDMGSIGAILESFLLLGARCINDRNLLQSAMKDVTTDRVRETVVFIRQ